MDPSVVSITGTARFCFSVSLPSLMDVTIVDPDGRQTRYLMATSSMEGCLPITVGQTVGTGTLTLKLTYNGATIATATSTYQVVYP